MEDHVGGVLLLARRPDMPQLSRDELERRLLVWRASNDLPSTIQSRDDVHNQWGPELHQVDLSHLDLSGMDLRCIKLLHCNLQGAILNSVKLDGAFLFGCNLSTVDAWNASFRYASLRQCYIPDARFMYGHFEGASLAYSNLENTKLIGSFHDRDTWFYRTRLLRTDFTEARLGEANFADAQTLFGVRLHRAHLGSTELDWALFGGKIGEELDQDLPAAAETYLAIKANLETRGFYSEAAQAYIKERKMERAASAPSNARKSYGAAQLGDKWEYSSEEKKWIRTELGARWYHPKLWWFYVRHTRKWLVDGLVEALCNYGESIWRVLFWMIAIIFVVGPAVNNLLGGLEWTGDNLAVYSAISPGPRQVIYGYYQTILYMIDTFTTASFAELKPANDYVRLFSGITALIGIFLTGLLGFVAGNKIRQS